MQSTTTSFAATAPSLRSLAYGASGIAPAMNEVALLNDTGSTYGLAYQRSSKVLYQGAYVKRAMKLGPGGLGAIYATPAAGGSKPVVIAQIPSVGFDGRSASMVAADWDRDHLVVPAVSRSGLGDLDMSADDRMLYVTNLANNGIYSAPVNGTSAVEPLGPLMVNGPGCGDWHIFGLGIDGTRGLVGGVCGQSLVAHVFSFVADGVASSLSPEPVLSFDLRYRKGEAIAWTPTTPDTGSNPWLAWNDAGENGPNVTKDTASKTAVAAPQPLLSDLVVSDRGDLVLGMRDRFGDQVGNRLIDIAGNLSPLVEGTAGGDLLLACSNGTAPGWTLERNGSCGGRTGSGVGNGEGPGDGSETGSGEFYAGEALDRLHEETAGGSVARLPGRGEIIATL